MRISDWSSDVCSSDLVRVPRLAWRLAGCHHSDAISVNRPYEELSMSKSAGRKAVVKARPKAAAVKAPVRTTASARAKKSPAKVVRKAVGKVDRKPVAATRVNAPNLQAEYEGRDRKSTRLNSSH